MKVGKRGPLGNGGTQIKAPCVSAGRDIIKEVGAVLGRRAAGTGTGENSTEFTEPQHDSYQDLLRVLVRPRKFKLFA